jgi:hypothetical protein
MAIQGIWTGEVYGPFGWEPRGVFIIEKGRIVGGGDRHYHMGSYTIKGKRVTAELQIHYYGPPRTMFGEAREQFTSQIEGVRKDGVIDGTIRRADRPQFDLQFRLTKRLDLPEV